MPSPPQTRPCMECGQPLTTGSKLTKCHFGTCAQNYRYKTNRKIEVASVAAPVAPRKPEPRPLVALIGEPLITPRAIKGSLRSRTHMVIPDCQVHDGVPTEHLEWVGRYIADKRPNVIVCIGDFADMPSLCSYDRGKKRSEGQRYVNDIEAARAGMERLVAPFRDIPGYKPRMVLTLGNHEDRISRAVEDYAVLEYAIGVHDLGYEAFGWEVHQFLEVVKIDGIEYAHFFVSGSKGKPVTSAAALLKRRQCSAVMGHSQHTDLTFHPQTQQIAIFCGTCYLHDEDYLGFQGNVQRRQILMLHEVNNGRFDPMFVSLEFLRRKYAA